MQLTGSQLTAESALFGNDIATFPDFPAEIRAPAGSLAGVSGFQLHFSSSEIYTAGDAPDVLVVMNPAAFKTNIRDLVDGGTLIDNTGTFIEANLKKAGYDSNPLDDESLRKRYRVHLIDISELTLAALAGTELSTKEKHRAKNFFALGLVFWLYSRDHDKEVANIQAAFGKKPALADANVRVFKAGYHYGETAEVFQDVYLVKPAKFPPGIYRNITGNEALALGLVAAAERASKNLFYSGYPITPASSLLHSLSGYKHFGVTTFQAEDEIAAIGAAIGAAYGGAIAITASSGPGIALKGEALGLAVMTELPMVIINVQRGGPSTGLPTKTEQSDLLQAMFGRNGESPVPIIAPSSPSDCFNAALEAVRVATTYRTPVFLLSDGYLANGSEPWRLPSVRELPDLSVEFATEANAVDEKGEPVFRPFLRDETTLARPWAVPGTPGLEHRIGGIEKADVTGNISYDPDNHDLMTRLRAAKVQGIAATIGDLEVDDPSGEAETLVVGWGSTYGPIAAAVRSVRNTGAKVARAHLRHLNPFPANTGDVLRGYRRVLVPEMNMGQLAMLLRARYLVDVQSFTQVRGLPFTTVELADAIVGVAQDVNR
jgi:2-oxoglutarate ferredoxin oxidoreductase subunit alpha